MLTLAELHQDSYPADHPVALGPDGAWCWADLLAQVAGLRQFLRSTHQTRWVLYDSDSYRFVCSLLGLLAEGCEVYLPGENHRALVDTLAGEDLAFFGEFPGVDSARLPAPCQPEMDQLLQLRGRVVVYTSGSTGAPKAIPKALHQLDADIEALETQFGHTLGDAVILGTVSHQHLYGLLFSALWPLCTGRPFWHRPFVDPELLAQQSLAFSRTSWNMSPGHLHRLGERMPWLNLRDCVAAVFSSGGPLSLPAAQQVQAGLGAPPWEVLGSSETSGIAIRQQWDEGAVWAALPGVAIRVDDQGRLSVQSPCLPDMNWYVTGDAAQDLGEGQFVLGLRVDRIVKLEGKRVSLPEVEQVLCGSPLIGSAHALALSADSRQLGVLISLESAGITKLCEQGLASLIKQLRTHCAQGLPAVAIPRRWRIVAHLPCNAQGKVVQRVALDLLQSRQYPPVLSHERIDDQHTLRLWLDPNNPYFEGHFPQTPILPGVAQVLWAQLLAAQYLGMETTYGDMRALKFKDTVGPYTVLSLSLRPDKRSKRLFFEYQSKSGVHSQGYLHYGD